MMHKPDAAAVLRRCAFLLGLRTHSRPLPRWLRLQLEDTMAQLECQLSAYCDGRVPFEIVEHAVEDCRKTLRTIDARGLGLEAA